MALDLSEGNLVNLCYEAVDHLSALVGTSWLTATVRQGPSGNRLGVAKIATTPGAGPQRDIPRALGIDLGVRSRLLSDCLNDVQAIMREAGLVWDGLTTHVKRDGQTDEDPIEIAFSTSFGARIAEIVLESPGTDLLVTDALLDIVEGESETWDLRDRALRGVVEGRKWRLAYEDSAVELEVSDGPPDAHPVVVIGSFNHKELSWCWSWASGSFQPYHYKKAAALRDAYKRRPGLSVLRFARFQCEEGFARAVANIAAERMGGLTVFAPQLADSGLQLYLALLEAM